MPRRGTASSARSARASPGAPSPAAARLPAARRSYRCAGGCATPTARRPPVPALRARRGRARTRCRPMSRRDRTRTPERRSRMPPAEAPPEYDLGEQAVRRRGESDADPGIEFPLGAEIDVHGRKELLRTAVERRGVADRSESTVILERYCDARGHVERYEGVGGKAEPRSRSRALERAVDHGIERDVRAADPCIDDRADFLGPGVFRVRAPFISNLLRQSHPDDAVPTLGHA